MSVSEVTDDSIRTEMTQISHKPESPSRGNSQKQFTVVVQIDKLNDGTRNNNNNNKKSKRIFWKDNYPNEKINRIWNVFKCIKSDSPKSKIKTEYVLTSSSSPQPYDVKPNHDEEGGGGFNGDSNVFENLKMEEDGENETKMILSSESSEEDNLKNSKDENKINKNLSKIDNNNKTTNDDEV